MQVQTVEGRGQQAERAPQLGRFEFGIIKKKVRQIIGRAGYTAQDQQDLEQELLARLLHSLKSFDPNQAHRKCFVTAVVERDVASILRDKQAEKRDHRRIDSLQVLIEVPDDGPTELAGTIGEREYNARRGRHPRSEDDLAQLTSDLAEVVASLPHELRDLAERLKTRSIKAVARETGVPRTTIQDRVRRLRKRFEQAGMRDYLGFRFVTSGRDRVALQIETHLSDTRRPR